MAIENFSWVIPQKLSGCAMPGGFPGCNPDYLCADLVELRSHHIHTLVSLQRMSSAFGECCRQSDLEWIHFPIEDFGTPPDSLSFDRLVKKIVRQIDASKPVCIHCRAGIGRTGLLLACVVGTYFLLDGAAAVAAVRQSRPAIDTDEQELFVHDYLQENPGTAGTQSQRKSGLKKGKR